MMSMSRNLRIEQPGLAIEHCQSGEILNRINYILKTAIEQQEGFENIDGMDIAFCSYNPKSRELKYAVQYTCTSSAVPIYLSLPTPLYRRGKTMRYTDTSQ